MATLVEQIRDKQALWDNLHARGLTEGRVVVVEVVELDDNTGPVATAVYEATGERFGVDYYRTRYGDLLAWSDCDGVEMDLLD